jgi:hypothetical protein
LFSYDKAARVTLPMASFKLSLQSDGTKCFGNLFVVHEGNKLLCQCFIR